MLDKIPTDFTEMKDMSHFDSRKDTKNDRSVFSDVLRTAGFVLEGLCLDNIVKLAVEAQHDPAALAALEILAPEALPLLKQFIPTEMVEIRR